MAKIRTSYFCQNCGAESAKWIGKCSSCGEWNTYVEEVVQKEESGRGNWHQGLDKAKRSSVPKKLQDISDDKFPRLITNDQELDRVLGGGMVPGSLIPIGGEPGIGESAVMLQIALMLEETAVLDVSGEDSESQIKMRAEVMGFHSANCDLLYETNTQ